MRLQQPAVFLLLVGAALANAPAAAQRFPALGGVDLRGAAVQNPADPHAPGTGASVDVDLGSFVAPILRPFVGGTWFTSEAPVGAGAGEIEATGGRAGVRLDVLGSARLAPYLFGAVTALEVKGSLDDEAGEALLTGFNTGATAGGGVVYALGGSRRIGLSAEGSYTWINNLNHWSAGVGLRVRPFGRGTYRRPPPATARVQVETYPGPVVHVTGPAPVAPPVVEPPAQPDSLRAEVDALRAEVARLSAARVDADAASAARAAEDERADALRAESDRMAAALAAATARADSLAIVSAAAAARVAEVEARTGAALLELSRLASATTSYRETERGIVVTLGDGLFPTGRTELSPAARAEVARVAYVLGHFRGRVLRVEGHTDDAGTEAANQALSERRAAAVRAALIAEGILPERVVAVGYGESRPAASNQTASGRAANRRVEVVITDAQS